MMYTPRKYPIQELSLTPASPSRGYPVAVTDCNGHGSPVRHGVSAPSTIALAGVGVIVAIAIGIDLELKRSPQDFNLRSEVGIFRYLGFISIKTS
jgi:hypothetical protein